jgi:hypothetical protein
MYRLLVASANFAGVIPVLSLSKRTNYRLSISLTILDGETFRTSAILNKVDRVGWRSPRSSMEI